MRDDLSESNEDFDRLHQQQRKDIQDAINGKKIVYMENYKGDIPLTSEKVSEPPSSVNIHPMPPVILNPAPVVTGKGYVLAIGLMFVLTVGMQLLLAWRDQKRDDEWQATVKSIDMELRRLHTAPGHRTETENGLIPPDKFKGEK